MKFSGYVANEPLTKQLNFGCNPKIFLEIFLLCEIASFQQFGRGLRSRSFHCLVVSVLLLVIFIRSAPTCNCKAVMHIGRLGIVY